MPTQRVWLTTCAVNGKIYAIGGTTDGDVTGLVATVEEYDPSIDLTAISSTEENIPHEFTLHQNHPNPFNPETQISFEIPNPSRVVLKVMNVLGQEIRTLVNEEKPAGHYKALWDGKDNFGQQVVSNVYVYKLETKNFIQTRKMMLVH